MSNWLLEQGGEGGSGGPGPGRRAWTPGLDGGPGRRAWTLSHRSLVL